MRPPCSRAPRAGCQPAEAQATRGRRATPGAVGPSDRRARASSERGAPRPAPLPAAFRERARCCSRSASKPAVSTAIPAPPRRSASGRWGSRRCRRGLNASSALTDVSSSIRSSPPTIVSRNRSSSARVTSARCCASTRQVGVDAAHHLDHLVHQVDERRLAAAEEVGVAHRAPQDPPQHVAAPSFEG